MSPSCSLVGFTAERSEDRWKDGKEECAIEIVSARSHKKLQEQQQKNHFENEVK